MTDLSNKIDALLLLLCKTTSQNPMSDKEIACLQNIKLDDVNALLDKLYEGKAIGSVKNIKGGVEQRLVWVTGLPYRPAPSMPKDIAWQHLRTQSPKDQPAPPKQETTMDDHPKTVLIVPTNLNDKGIKTPQKIVRFLFANTKATSNEIREHCNLKDIDSFIKAYVRKGYIERTKNEAKLVVYSISPKGRLLGSADALYNQAKVKQPTKIMADNKKPSMDDRIAIDQVFEKLITVENADQTNKAKVDGFFDDDGRRYKPLEIQQEPEKIEFKLDTTQHIRFALTDEGTLMILGVQYAPIELSKEDTKRLYDFAENTAHAI